MESDRETKKIIRSIRLTISYDGTNYAGWQVQPNARTIQGVLERSLEHIFKEKYHLIGAGRTDSGVHALGQEAHFKTGSKLPLNNIKMALNSILPKDIAITNVSEEDPDFHARKQALLKKYIYKIYRGKTRDPFLWHYTWHLHEALNICRIKSCLPVFQGEHDFSAFSVADKGTTNGIRKLLELKLIEEGDLLILEFLGNGFLRKQIRRIVGTLVDVGKNRFNKDRVKMMLLSKDPTQAGPTAPSKGLFLIKVYYS